MPVLDTWVWLEYFGGSAAVAGVKSAVEGPDVATCVLTLAELSDVYGRDGRAAVLDDRIHFIHSRGPVLPVSEHGARKAGATKWNQRKRGHPLGLADAIIYETAREHGLELVTGDEGFKGLDGVRMVSAKVR